MTVSLTPEQEQFVSEEVSSGRYHSASDVIHKALRLLEEQQQDRAAQLKEFNDELDRRLDSAEHVVWIEPEELRRRFAAKAEARRIAQA
jgi:antitoxin ParD1/3/4